MLTYATVADLPGTPPDNAQSLIDQASALVRRATRSAVYAVDANAAPTDAALALAFKQAVVAQVGYWAENDIDPATGSTGAAAVSSVSSGGQSVSFDSAAAKAQGEARAASLTGLVPAAMAYLDGITGPVVAW